MTRSRGDHLNTADLKIIRDGFTARIRARDIAEQLGCTKWTVNKHYAKLKAETASAVPAPSRFYHSDFVPR